MKFRWILLLGLAALAGGCATPNLERIATVQSRAEALYAYGGVATFPVASELVEVSVFAPVHHQREYLPIPIEREKTKPIVNRQPAKPADSEQPTKAAVSEQSAKPAASEEKTKPVVSEPDHSADADTQANAAPTKAEEAASQPKEKLPENAETTEAQKVPVVSREQPAAQIDKPQAAD